jgi:hypothetical protein
MPAQGPAQGFDEIARVRARPLSHRHRAPAASTSRPRRIDIAVPPHRHRGPRRIDIAALATKSPIAMACTLSGGFATEGGVNPEVAAVTSRRLARRRPHAVQIGNRRDRDP